MVYKKYNDIKKDNNVSNIWNDTLLIEKHTKKLNNVWNNIALDTLPLPEEKYIIFLQQLLKRKKDLKNINPISISVADLKFILTNSNFLNYEKKIFLNSFNEYLLNKAQNILYYDIFDNINKLTTKSDTFKQLALEAKNYFLSRPKEIPKIKKIGNIENSLKEKYRRLLLNLKQFKILHPSQEELKLTDYVFVSSKFSSRSLIGWKQKNFIRGSRGTINIDSCINYINMRMLDFKKS